MRKQARAIAQLSAALFALPGLAGCALYHETVGVGGVNDVPPPRAVAQPADMASFQSAPLTPPALRAHVEQLASNAFEGRAPASAGEVRTVDYIARAFTAAGLQPGARGADGRMGWLQEVPLSVARVANAPPLTITHGADVQTLRYGADYIAWSKHLEPSVSLSNAELVFAGYGVAAPELGRNDYAGIDMHGRIALILANDPDYTSSEDHGFGGRAMSAAGLLSSKIDEAARQGAAGVLVIHETGAVGEPWTWIAATYTGQQFDLVREDGGASRPMIEGWITSDAAQALLTRAGQDLAILRGQAQSPDFHPTLLGATASITLNSEHETRMSHNVIGVLLGGAHPNEAVLYMAHWDHLGHCPPVRGDDICNGALDNASGVAGLIELARRFAGEDHRARSIAFIAFTGEEAGELGSRFYASHPAFAPERTVAAINLHMLNVNGPTRDIVAVGSGGGDLEHRLADAAASQSRRVSSEAHPEHGAFYRSDAYSLAQIGVPTLYPAPGYDLYEGGEARGRALSDRYFSERYHTPDDELESYWDFTGAMRDLILLHDVGAQLASSDDWPNWRASSEFRALRDAQRSRQR